MLGVFKAILLVGLLIYAAAVAVMYFAQHHFLYFPDPLRTRPAEAGLPEVSERIVATPDGERIVAWYGKARSGEPTLLYFHGNGGALELRAERIRKYLDRGRGMFMMAYRGYSGSTGMASEVANVADAKLAYEALIKEGVAPENIILYGESLGSGVAIQLAAHNEVGGVILDSPFTSIAERAQQLYPWLPVGLLLRDRYDSVQHIAGMRAPLFILHGEADDVVPVEMGRRLFAVAHEPKEITTLPGAGHGDHYKFGSFETITAWIDRLVASQKGR